MCQCGHLRTFEHAHLYAHGYSGVAIALPGLPHHQDWLSITAPTTGTPFSTPHIYSCCCNSYACNHHIENTRKATVQVSQNGPAVHQLRVQLLHCLLNNLVWSIVFRTSIVSFANDGMQGKDTIEMVKEEQTETDIIYVSLLSQCCVLYICCSRHQHYYNYM